jgi:hypothetical protein
MGAGRVPNADRDAAHVMQMQAHIQTMTRKQDQASKWSHPDPSEFRVSNFAPIPSPPTLIWAWAWAGWGPSRTRWLQQFFLKELPKLLSVLGIASEPMEVSSALQLK